tara:strand:- start:546 stop:761 length:216 start_codon:yes stop_codon:yes gene_type:complete
MENEHLQTLIDCKQIFELSQSRGCWKMEEVKNVVLLYENLNNIINHYNNLKNNENKKNNLPVIEELEEKVN